jgi:predicted TIM-barrel fold metal-dependent hydrolase
MLDLSEIKAIDNHCHPPLHLPPPRTAAELARFFTEATDTETIERHIPHSLFFRRAIVDLSDLLESFASVSGVTKTASLPLDASSALAVEEMLARRAAYSAGEWFKLMVEKANLSALLVDTGYPRRGGWTVEEAQASLNTLPEPVSVHTILRLERLIEDLIVTSANFSQLEEHFRQSLREARSQGVVGLKSIIAYRTGLAVQFEANAVGEAQAGFNRLKSQVAATGQPVRVADKALLDYLLGVALEEAAKVELPVQFHCGFGDRDADLILSNPALLRPVLEEPRWQKAPVVLLHCYPYVREAAYLASVYPQVYMDLSLASPLVFYGGGRALEEALGLAPTTKLLYGSDAWGVPDIIYLGSLHTRHRLGQLLEEWIGRSWITEREAREIADNFFVANARRLYQL